MLPALSYPNVVTMYGVVLTVMGMFIAWPAPACNNPVFAEIVPPPMRNMVYGAQRRCRLASHHHVLPKLFRLFRLRSHIEVSCCTAGRSISCHPACRAVFCLYVCASHKSLHMSYRNTKGLSRLCSL